MNRFIEVVGTAILVERVKEYCAEVTVQVRAAQVEAALKEAAELRAACIRQLRAAGLGEHELQEGGAEVWRPWFWKKKQPGQEATHKVLVKCDDIQKLMRALATLEPLFENQRHTLTVSMRQPVFEAADDARRDTERAAIADAGMKAGNVAAACGLRIAGALEVEELAHKVSASGVYGDHEWAYGGMTRGGGGDLGEPEPTLEAATRTSTVRYRVRFEAEALTLASQAASPPVGERPQGDLTPREA